MNVLGTTGALKLVGGSSATTVNVGRSGSVQSIRGAVSVSNPPSYTGLTIDDSADTVGRTATVTASGITGLAPTPINYAQTAINALNVRGGAAGDDFILTGLPSNFYLTPNLWTGGGDDRVEIGSGLSGSLSVDICLRRSSSDRATITPGPGLTTLSAGR